MAMTKSQKQILVASLRHRLYAARIQHQQARKTVENSYHDLLTAMSDTIADARKSAREKFQAEHDAEFARHTAARQAIEAKVEAEYADQSEALAALYAARKEELDNVPNITCGVEENILNAFVLELEFADTPIDPNAMLDKFLGDRGLL